MPSLISNPLKLIFYHMNGWNSVHRVLGLSCMALLMVISSGCRKDSAQWKVAAAEKAEDNGNPEVAIELLQEALRLDPDSDAIKLRLARVLAKNDQGDLSQTLCDEVLENDGSSKIAWHVRSECWYQMGRFDESLAAYQQYVADKIDKSSDELNQLAYFRSLAGVQLDKALRQINEGIGKYERQFVPVSQQEFSFFETPKPSWGGYSVVTIEVNALVSAGLMSRYTDQGHKHVMGFLNARIQQEQQLWLAMNAIVDRMHQRQESQGEDVTDQEAEVQDKRIKEASDLLERSSGNLPLLLATRSLILNDQGQTELADLDRLWLKQIGVQPQDIFNALPSDLECMAALAGVQAILDTRGHILTQLPWRPTWTRPSGDVMQIEDRASRITYGSYELALQDLDLAIAAAEIRLLALNSDAVNRIEHPVESVKYEKSDGSKLLAILRNHRRQAHLKARQIEAAELDWKRIEELGFDEEDNLF